CDSCRACALREAFRTGYLPAACAARDCYAAASARDERKLCVDSAAERGSSARRRAAGDCRGRIHDAVVGLWISLRRTAGWRGDDASVGHLPDDASSPDTGRPHRLLRAPSFAPGILPLRSDRRGSPDERRTVYLCFWQALSDRQMVLFPVDIPHQEHVGVSSAP